MAYEFLREKVLQRDENGEFALWKGIVAGMSAGAAGQFIANPTDVVKVQMQMDGKRVAQGKKPHFSGTMHAMKTIYGQRGFKGMWRGWVPSCQRAGLVQLGDLTTYDYAKQKLKNQGGIEEGPMLHALSSACAGLVAAGMGTPADVIKTRVMNQPVDAAGKGECCTHHAHAAHALPHRTHHLSSFAPPRTAGVGLPGARPMMLPMMPTGMCSF